MRIRLARVPKDLAPVLVSVAAEGDYRALTRVLEERIHALLTELAERRRSSPGHAARHAPTETPRWLIPDVATSSSTVKDARARLANLEATRLEIQSSIADGKRVLDAVGRRGFLLARSASTKDLIPRGDIERAWTSQILGARAKLLALPGLLGARLNHAALLRGIPAVSDALDDAITEVLSELPTPTLGTARAASRKK